MPRLKVGAGVMNPFQAMMLVIIPVVFVGMLGAFWFGRRLGKAHFERNAQAAAAGGSTIDAAIFALLGLLVAFTFSGAAERFDRRKQLIVEESNAIGTAYLRIDLLPQAVQPALRQDFRRYLDTRIAFYRSLETPEVATAHKIESERLQNSIWTQAVSAASQMSSPAPTMLVVTSLNAMIDITATRMMSLLTHPPKAIYVLLAILAVCSAVLAGFGMAPCERPSKFHVYCFTFVVTLTVYITMEIEYPRAGIIRLDGADQVLIDLRRSMH
jgi:hypothetical protein